MWNKADNDQIIFTQKSLLTTLSLKNDFFFITRLFILLVIIALNRAIGT